MNKINFILLFKLLFWIKPAYTQPPIPIDATFRPPVCPNGSVEDGNFNGWTGYTGSYSTSTNNLNIGIVPGRQTIQIPGIDTYGNFPTVIHGNRSIRLGNSVAGSQSDWISYTFTVNNINKIFQFKYALVLQDPGHDQADQPDFTYYAVVGNSINAPGNIPALFSSSYTRIIADRNNPFFQISNASNDIVYRKWTCRSIDLTNYVGQTVTVVFRVRDCQLGGHWGYAYIDGLCQNFNAIADFDVPAIFCKKGTGVPIYADGTASLNELSHFWEVAESNSSWQYTNPSNTFNQWFVNQEAGIIDIYNWFISKGGVWKCNTYYRIKLAVSSECTGWSETTKLIYFKCPDYDPGPDQKFCCNLTPLQTIIGQNPVPDGMTFSWWSNPFGFTSTDSQFEVTVGQQSMAYNVTYSDSDGCTGEDVVNVIVMGSPNVIIEKLGTCCNPSIKAYVSDNCSLNDNAYFQTLKEEYYTYLWTPSNNTTNTLTNLQPNTNYTVTVNNGCGQASATTTTGQLNQPTGLTPPNIIFNNTILVNSSIPANAKMTIWHFTPNNLPCYYNATRYRLRVFNRWGQLIYEKDSTSSNCCFSDGAITWMEKKI